MKKLSIVLLVLIATTVVAATPALAKKSDLYEQGFARGVSDANRNPTPTTSMTSNDVDCDNDNEPIFDEAEFCSGYQHGYADQNNKLLGK